MIWWETTILAIAVAFVTSLLTENFKIWLYRNKHIDERRFLLQVDWLPKYVEALDWASTACIQVNNGWLVQGADPFAYATKAMAKMMEARNVGIATACFFEKQSMRPNILDFGDVMLQAYTEYRTSVDAATPAPTKLTKEMRDIFERMAGEIQGQGSAMRIENGQTPRFGDVRRQ